MAADVGVLSKSLGKIHGCQHTIHEVTTWETQINTFGLHFARLDVRQNAKVYRQVLDELFRELGLFDSYASLDEAAKCKLLQESLAQQRMKGRPDRD